MKWCSERGDRCAWQVDSPGLRYALMGPDLICRLGGGAHGIYGLLKHVENSVELWLADMAAGPG